MPYHTTADDTSEAHPPEGGGTQVAEESIDGNATGLSTTVLPAQSQGPPALPPRPANLPVPGIPHPPHAFSRTTTTSKKNISQSDYRWYIFKKRL